MLVPIEFVQRVLEVAGVHGLTVVHDADESLELLLADRTGLRGIERVECNYSHTHTHTHKSEIQSFCALRAAVANILRRSLTLQDLVPGVHAVEHHCVHELFKVDLRASKHHDKVQSISHFQTATKAALELTVPLQSASIMRKSPSENGVLVSSMNSKNSS